MSSINQLKQSIKQWEADFIAQNQRQPSKHDVKSDQNIASLYVQYGKLLKAASLPSNGQSDSQSINQSENQSINALSRTSSIIYPIKSSLSNTLSRSSLSLSTDSPGINRDRKRQRIDDDEFSFQPVSRTESSIILTDNTQRLNNDSSLSIKASTSIDATTIRPPQSLSKRVDVTGIQAGSLSTVNRTATGAILSSLNQIALGSLSSINRAISQPFGDATLKQLIDAKRSETASAAASEANNRIREVYTQKSSTGCRVGFVDTTTSQSLSRSTSVIYQPKTQSNEKSALEIEPNQSFTQSPPLQSTNEPVTEHDDDYQQENQSVSKPKTRSRTKPRSTKAISETDEDYHSIDDSDNELVSKKSIKKRAKPSSTHARKSTTSKAEPSETQPIKRSKKSESSQTQSAKRPKKAAVVSTNFVRTDLKHKTKAYSREGGSSVTARKKAFRERRGWTNRWERAAEERQRHQSAKDAANEELVDVAQVKAVLGYNSDDDRQALAAFESPPASSLIEFTGSFNDTDAYSLIGQHFGHSAFREGQLESINFTMNSPTSASLLIQPTGHGKSLCYLIPALKLRLSVVVSPLLALMSDQCLKLPAALPGVVWNGSCTKEEVERIISRVRFGDARLLYVSPEKFVSASFVAFMQSLTHIDMIVIDEAHCITQWSHNFRPCYLYLKTVISSLRRRPRVLAMTATSTPDTENEIASSLGLDGLQVMRHGPRVRTNIKCRVKRVLEDNKDTQVVDWINEFVLMCGKRAPRRGIIVYVNFREHADRLSRLLSTHGIQARAYHAGMSSIQRQAAQALFLDNSLHVMVATIAFGLGIDKPNIGLVVHTFLPASLSSYTQEIGRAGRDGLESHAWMCFSDKDELNQRSWIHRQGVDEGQMRQFVRRCFSVKCEESEDVQHVDFHAPYAQLRLDKLKADTSLEPEVAETLLAQIELAGNPDDEPCLKLVGSSSLHVDITFARSWDSLQQMSLIDSPLAALVRSLLSCYPQISTSANAAIACNFKRVSLPKLANAMHEELTTVTQSLMTLRAMREVTLHWSKDTALVIRLTCHHACDTLEHAERLISIMKRSNVRAQQASTSQVDAVIAVLRACERETSDEQSGTMHDWLTQHFSLSDRDFARSINDDDDDELADDEPMGEIHPLVIALVNECTLARRVLTARSYACILHGMSSTSVKTKEWKHCQYWSKLKHIAFVRCQQQAERAMARLREQTVIQQTNEAEID